MGGFFMLLLFSVCLLRLFYSEEKKPMEGPKHHHGSSSSEEKRLELRLGPPGDHDWATRDDSSLSLNHLSNTKPVDNSWINIMNNKYYFQSLPVRGQDMSQPCSTRTVDKAAKTAVPNSSQKRSAPAPVVGWPPIRSFRRNLATTSSSKSPETENVVPNKVLSEKPAEKISTQKGFLVKINMDGVPIGRKVDLKVHDSYEKLSSAVDDLFRGLLAAQRDSSTGDIQNKQEGGDKEIISGLVDGISGEYTLVYEDNEGDRMLVGDVPWHMFVSTVKRLRVLKTSELPKLSFGTKQR